MSLENEGVSEVLYSENSFYRLNLEISIENDNYQLDDELSEVGNENVKLSARDIIHENFGQVLVFRFSKNHCESCVENSISLLINWMKSNKDVGVLFLGFNHNNIIFEKELVQYGINNLNVYNVRSLGLPIENLNYPYYFLWDKNLRVSNVFVPDKALPHLSFKYLDAIKNRMNSNVK